MPPRLSDVPIVSDVHLLRLLAEARGAARAHQTLQARISRGRRLEERGNGLHMLSRNEVGEKSRAEWGVTPIPVELRPVGPKRLLDRLELGHLGTWRSTCSWSLPGPAHGGTTRHTRPAKTNVSDFRTMVVLLCDVAKQDK